MNADFFKNTSTKAHVDLGSVHMIVKQPINSVGKKINWFNINIKQAICSHEDQTTVRQNFYFLINGIDVRKHCLKLTSPCPPYKGDPGALCYFIRKFFCGFYLQFLQFKSKDCPNFLSFYARKNKEVILTRDHTWKPQLQAQISISTLQLFPSCIISFLLISFRKDFLLQCAAVYYAAQYTSGNILILKSILNV